MSLAQKTLVLLFIAPLLASLLLATTSQPDGDPQVLYLDYMECELVFDLSWYSPAREVRLALQNISLPDAQDFQTVLLKTPALRMLEDVYGNRYACYETTDRNLRVGVKASLLGSVLHGKLHVGDLREVPAEVKERYTKPEALIESDDPTVMSKAEELKARSAGLLSLVENVFNFVREHLTYREVDVPKGARWALEFGQGDCSEYSCLMVALLRAAEVPSRVSTGYAFDPEQEEFHPHSWVEVYLPKLGWVPFDPTWGLTNCWRHLTLLHHSNEREGPFVAEVDGREAGMKVRVQNIRHASFSDFIQVDENGFVFFERSFADPKLPSSSVSLGPNSALNCSAAYYSVYVKTQSFLGLTALQYAVLDGCGGGPHQMLIQGPIGLHYYSVQHSEEADCKLVSEYIDGKPTLKAMMDGTGYVVITVYYFPLLYIALYAITIGGAALAIRFVRKKLRRTVNQA